MTTANPPTPAADPVKARRAFVDGFVKRLNEPGVAFDQRAQLEAAWDAGFNSGARQEGKATC